MEVTKKLKDGKLSSIKTLIVTLYIPSGDIQNLVHFVYILYGEQVQ